MNTKTPASGGRGTDNGELAPTVIFDALASDRRRYVLHYLGQRAGEVALGELAEQIAIWEDAPTFDQYERILTSLHHVHLPKLADTGIVRYESESETVTGGEAADQLTPYLELATPEDFG